MSDVFEGPGYWMASDGKWYSPDRHPDSAYRERFATVMPSLPNVPEPEVLMPPAIPDQAVVAEGPLVADVDKPVASEFPSVELHSQDAPAVSTPLADIHRTRSDATTHPSPLVGDEDPVEAPDESPHEISETVAPSFSVASAEFGSVPQRPVFDGAAPRSVTEAPTPKTTQRFEVDNGTVELEIDRTPARAPQVAPLRSADGPGLSTSTALAVIPTPPEPPRIPVYDRFLAAVLFCAGVAMIVGTFLDWTSGSLVQTGWERGDGIATVVAGIIGSAAAGPIYVGYHHIVPKTAAIIAGLVGAVVVGLAAISILVDKEASDTSLAIGFFVVLIGASMMTVAGITHRIEPQY